LNRVQGELHVAQIELCFADELERNRIADINRGGLGKQLVTGGDQVWRK
jgi:hypothetical protein